MGKDKNNKLPNYASVYGNESIISIRERCMEIYWHSLKALGLIVSLLTLTVVLLIVAIATFGSLKVPLITDKISHYVNNTILPENIKYISQGTYVKWNRKLYAIELCTEGNRIQDEVSGRYIELPNILLNLNIKNLLSFSKLDKFFTVNVTNYKLSGESLIMGLNFIFAKNNAPLNDTRINAKQTKNLQQKNIVQHEQINHLRNVKILLERLFHFLPTINIYNVEIQIPQNLLTYLNKQKRKSNNIAPVRVDEPYESRYSTILINDIIIYTDSSGDVITGHGVITIGSKDASRTKLDFAINKRIIKNNLIKERSIKSSHSKNLAFECAFSNLQSELIRIIYPQFPLSLKTYFSGNFMLYISDAFKIDNIDFTLFSESGKLSKNIYVANDINLTNISLSGTYNWIKKVLIIKNTYNITKQSDLNIFFQYDFKEKKAYIECNINNIKVEELYKNWSDAVLVTTRDWLRENVKDSVIFCANVKIYLSGNNTNNKNDNKNHRYFDVNDNISGSITLRGGMLTYSYPKVEDKHRILIDEAQINFDKSEVKIDVKSAKTEESIELADCVAKISKLQEEEQILTIEGKAKSKLVNAIDVTLSHLYPNVKVSNSSFYRNGLYDNTKIVSNSKIEEDNIVNALYSLRNADGDLESNIKISFPLNSNNITNSTQDKTDFIINGNIKRFSLHKLLNKYDIFSNKLKIRTKNNKTVIDGAITINNLLNLNIYIEDILRKTPTQQIDSATLLGLTFNDIQVEQFQKFTDFFIGNNVSGKASGNVKINLKGNIAKIQALVDLKNINILYSQMLLSKPNGIGGKLVLNSTIKDFNLNYTDNVKIPKISYLIEMPNFKSNGIIYYDTEQKIVFKIASNDTKLGDSDFRFNYINTKVKTTNEDKIKHSTQILGQKIDLSWLTFADIEDIINSTITNNSKKSIIDVKVSAEEILLKNNQKLINTKLDFICEKGVCDNININSMIKGIKDENITIYKKKNIISAHSENAGKFLKAFDLYKNMEKGILDFYIDIDKNQNWGGSFDIHNFSIKNAPILAELLKLASITSAQFLSIFDLLKIGQIAFNKMNCEISYINDKIFFENCKMLGNSVNITGQGYYDLTTQYIAINGYMTPFSLIGNIMEVLKKGLDRNSRIDKNTEKKDKSFNFSIEGELGGKIKVNSNPFSVIAPSFIGEAFAKRKKHTKLSDTYE